MATVKLARQISTIGTVACACLVILGFAFSSDAIWYVLVAVFVGTGLGVWAAMAGYQEAHAEQQRAEGLRR